MAGRPYLGNASSAVFSVFSLPAYVLPFWRSLALIAALKLFVAALGTFLLARELGMRFAGALTAGLGSAFSLWMVAWVPWPEASVFAFLPWLCADDRAPGPSPRSGSLRRTGRGRGPAALRRVPGSSFHVLRGHRGVLALYALALRFVRRLAPRPTACSCSPAR